MYPYFSSSSFFFSSSSSLNTIYSSGTFEQHCACWLNYYTISGSGLYFLSANHRVTSFRLRNNLPQRFFALLLLVVDYVVNIFEDVPTLLIGWTQSHTWIHTLKVFQRVSNFFARFRRLTRKAVTSCDQDSTEPFCFFPSSSIAGHGELFGSGNKENNPGTFDSFNFALPQRA